MDTDSESSKTQQQADATGRADLTVNEHGAFVATTPQQASRVVKLWVESGMVPAAYRPGQFCRDLRRPLGPQEAVTRALGAAQYLASLKVPVLPNLRYVAIIDGTPMVHSDLPLALVMRSGLAVAAPDEVLITRDHQVISFEAGNLHEVAWGALCRMQRKGGPVATRVFTLDHARQARLYPAEDGSGVSDKWGSTPWARHTRRMLQMRARSHMLKDLFPDVLSGVAIAEYDGPHGFVADGVAPEQPAHPHVVDVSRAPPRPSPAMDLDAAYPDEPEADR